MRRRIGIAAALALVAATLAAPDAVRAQADPRPLPPGDPRSIPEKIEPRAPSAGGDGSGRGEAGSSLSERLDRTDGVLKPPTGIDPGIHVPAPVPNPGTTPVIPPPGSAGSDIQPK